MQYKREDKIQHRIIRSENVMDIARFYEKIAQEESGTCTFRVRFSDKNYEVEHSSQLFELPAFKYKDASSIEFLYESADCCSRISLSLYECIIDSAIMNKYIVKSENKAWLNRKEKTLKELIDSIQKQSIFRKVFCFPWMFIVLFAVYALEVAVSHSFGFYYDNLPPITNIPPNTFEYASVTLVSDHAHIIPHAGSVLRLASAFAKGSRSTFFYIFLHLCYNKRKTSGKRTLWISFWIHKNRACGLWFV